MNVEAKVTASHVVHGRRCTDSEINNSNMAGTVVGAAVINVEAKVTASHVVHGRRCTEINNSNMVSTETNCYYCKINTWCRRTEINNSNMTGTMIGATENFK
jgi:late competence protein required for DNA uptake (superfamily II DNA/RNA helicase)